VHRQEIYEQIQKENKSAAEASGSVDLKAAKNLMKK
jgi:sRNA-binding carbon storage regulator CsrA